MSADRRVEFISATLGALSTTLCFWSVQSLVSWLEPNLTTAMGCGIAPTEYVLEFTREPFSIESGPWLLGPLLIAIGALLRRRQRAETVALVLLFLGPLAPFAMLALSMTALLAPFRSVVIK